MPLKLQHPELPKDIIAAFELLQNGRVPLDTDIKESLNGSRFLKKMANEYLKISDIQVLTEKYKKPKAFYLKRELSVSFSHTKDALTAAISASKTVGCDMEEAGRSVHQRLAKRIQHPGENLELYNKNPLIRVWTLKEAALKCIGTGLRKPMNGVKILPVTESLFDVQFDDGREAKICSFQHQEHWISICYHNNADN